MFSNYATDIAVTCTPAGSCTLALIPPGLAVIAALITFSTSIPLAAVVVSKTCLLPVPKNNLTALAALQKAVDTSSTLINF